MHPKKYKDMMSWLTRNKSTNPKDHIVDTLNKYEDTPNIKSKPDILRNILIEEMKTRDLDSDEIRYLMDTKDRSELPKATPKQTAFIKKKVVPEPFKKIPKKPIQNFKFDPTLVSVAPKIVKPIQTEQERNFLKMVEDNKKEKERTARSGIGALLS